MKAELGSASTADPAVQGGFDLVPEHAMSLSVASSATQHGRPLRSDLAGLSTLATAGADALQGPSVAPSWSWTPTSTGSGRRDARVANLMAVLTQFRAQEPNDRSAPSSNTGAAKSDATPPRVVLNDASATAASTAASWSNSVQQIGSPQSQGLPQATPSEAVTVSSSSASTADQSAANDVAVVAELKLEALFKTLQAYGL